MPTAVKKKGWVQRPGRGNADSKCVLRAEEGRRLARDILKALADHDAVEDTVKYDIEHLE